MADAIILQGHLTQAQFDANPIFILGDGQIAWLKDNSGKFKKGDGVTQLSALPFIQYSKDLSTVLGVGNEMLNTQSIVSEDGLTSLKVIDNLGELKTATSGVVVEPSNGATIYNDSGIAGEFAKVQSFEGANILQADVLNRFDAPINNFPQETASKIAVFDASSNLKSGTLAESDLLTVNSALKQEVKLAENITKGQAVYISSANGTNVIVSKASNATEATSSKTLGLLETTGVINDILYVITEGMLGGLNTGTATIGDAVWLGTSGNLIFGLASKPVAPAHLVYIGVVSRVHATNGEILVKVQNGFELNEIHDVLTSSNVTTPVDADALLIKENSSGLWKSLSWANLKNVLNIQTKQVIQITSSTAPTVDTTGYRRTFVDITAQAGNINLSTNLTGTPQNGDVLIYQIKDNGTARTITMGTLFEAKGEALPTTTVISKRINIGATWDSTTSKWGVIAVAQEV